ncbi:DedA family protein [Tsukamurella pseudospumae]|uniref:VTT domain-containing protein n=1 Tax=Tsukamurella pseudospumae TaxID=239498 RepID=A0A138ABN2_9ACTN|nr:DedA family protein [Tsukamurella pseudospumae]KXP01126.1 hypothetical protein AXK61_13780 [Tsukamurella pseudospumae]KXP07908.1 hypothetical protein AXK60_09535 [Tsukamurella pseudospumae]
MQQFIVSFGLLAVFALMFAESACIPVPSEVTMLLAGALAAGAVPGAHLNLVAVIAAGTLGNVAGSYLAWWIGREGGRPAVRRWGRYVRLHESDLDRAQEWFQRRGSVSVFAGRLLPVIRTFISLPAGIAGMPPVRFGLLTFAGCLPWTAALAVAGYAVGTRWESIANACHGPTYVIAALVGVAFCSAAWVFYRRRGGREGLDEA